MAKDILSLKYTPGQTLKVNYGEQQTVWDQDPHALYRREQLPTKLYKNIGDGPVEVWMAVFGLGVGGFSIFTEYLLNGPHSLLGGLMALFTPPPPCDRRYNIDSGRSLAATHDAEHQSKPSRRFLHLGE